MEQKEEMYMKEGQMGGAVGGVVMLIVGIGVAVVVLIFSGTLSAQTYQLVEADIDAITNTTIKDSVKDGIISGFDALEKTGKYLPLIVLAIVITVVLSLIVGMGFGLGGAGGRGSAL